MIYQGGGYKILLVLHLLSVVVAFGPWFLNGMFPSAARRRSTTASAAAAPASAADAASAWAEAKAINQVNLRVSTMSQFAMYGVFVFGFATLSAAPKGSISASDGWVIGAIVVWVAIIGVLHALVLPAQRALAAGNGDLASVTTRQAIGAGIINVLVIVAVFLMVFGPQT